MNLVDMMMLFTVAGCPVAAGIAAVTQKSGWFTLPLIAVGVAIGFGCSFCIHRLSYKALSSGSKKSPTAWFWSSAYAVVAIVGPFGSMVLTAGLTTWLAHHIL